MHSIHAYDDAIYFLNRAAEHRTASDEAERSDYPTACALLARADAALARAVSHYEMCSGSFTDRSRLRALIAAESDALARARR
jgi:hypothetical protein